MPLVTESSPPVGSDELPAPVSFWLRADRCVVELTMRVMGIAVLRGRLSAVAGTCDVIPGSDDGAQVTLDLASASLKTGIPLLARVLTGKSGLDAADHPVIPFTASRVRLGDDGAVRLAGAVEVQDHPVPLVLTGTVYYSDPERIVLWVRGQLPPRRARGAGRIARLIARRRIQVEAAVEYVR